MIFYDSETYPIKPALAAPPVVCSQWAFSEGQVSIVLASETKTRLQEHLDKDLIVGHNIAYDMACAASTWPDLLPLIFEAYINDRISCTQIRQRLITLGTDDFLPRDGLVHCLDKNKISHEIDKQDPWRLRYSELKDTPVEKWSKEALEYARGDVIHGHALYHRQESQYLEDEYRQSRAAFWLYLVTCWGMKTDKEAIQEYGRLVEDETKNLRGILQAEGLVRPTGVKDTKKAKKLLVDIYQAKGLEVPKTDKGGVSLDADACNGSEDATLRAYATYTSLGSKRGRIKRLKAAGDYPIQPRYTTILATGRTSCSQGKTKEGQPVKTFGDQVHNMDRDKGPRECYIPREGCVFVAADWAGAELHALAQACIDMGLDSVLAKRLNEGIDVHLWFACTMKGWDYDQVDKKDPVVKEARQFSKIANFGLPGGLGADMLVSWAWKAYGFEMTKQQAIFLKKAWLKAFPEMKSYFDIISSQDKHKDTIILPRSYRYRKGASYCARANHYFQGPASDMMKDAGFNISRRCYVGDLRPARIVNQIHDEFILETPIDKGHDHAMIVVEEMEAAGRRWMPDCPPKAEPSLMMRWSKNAHPVWVDDKLVPWDLTG